MHMIKVFFKEHFIIYNYVVDNKVTVSLLIVFVQKVNKKIS